MASCKQLLVYLLLVFTITIISGSSRGNSISRSGSSPYTRSTFRAALNGSYIYNSARYTRSSRYRSNPNELPPICTNMYDKDSNGTTYGYFICPRAGEPEDHEYCCGDHRREHCCEYYIEIGRIVGIVFGALGGVVFLSVLIYCYINSGKNKKKVDDKLNNPRQDSKKNTTISPVPTSAPAKKYNSKSTELTTAATDNPYENKGFTGDSTTSPAYDNKTVPSYSIQPPPAFLYSDAPAATAPMGFDNSDSAHYPPPPSYSQAVKKQPAYITEEEED